MDTQGSFPTPRSPDADFPEQVAALNLTETTARRLYELGARLDLRSIDRGPASLNPTFFVIDESGRKYFVKFIHDPQRMQNELLMHRLKHHFHSFSLPELVDSSPEHLVCEFVVGTSMRDLIRSDPDASLALVAAVVEELDANAEMIAAHLSSGWRSSNPLGRARRQVHTPLIQQSAAYPIVTRFLSGLDERQCATDEMVTGDFRLDHMLVDQGRRCVLIDWEWLQLADRNLDYATLFNQAFKYRHDAALSLYQFLSRRAAFRKSNFLLFSVSGMLFYIDDYTTKGALPAARRWLSCLETLLADFAQDFAEPVAGAPPIDQNVTWVELEKTYCLKGVPFRTESDARERVYLLDQEVWKMRAAPDDSPRQGVAPSMEAECLRRVARIAGTCRLKRFVKETDHTILILRRFHHVGTLATVTLPVEVQDRVDHAWRRILREVNDAGVLHNDARPDKFLVGADYELCLVGFIHAERRRSSDFLAGSIYRPPGPPVRRVGLLGEAWDLALRWQVRGKGYSYNSLTVDNVHFPGDRSWEERWALLGPALRAACGGSLAGKRILELGCNVGLLSVWAAREGATCRGYDSKDYLVEAATRVARAFAVEERCSFRKCDLNDVAAIASAAESYDICTLLSVLVWVKNPASLIDFLSRQQAVLYEGHDTPEAAALRLEQCGFGRIRVIGISDRQRFLFLATR